MSGLGWFGILCLTIGLIQVLTHVRRKQWPLVQAYVDSVDGQIDASATGDDIAIQPRYIHQLRYSFNGRNYSVKLPDRELHAHIQNVRVNPKKPDEALFEDRSLIFPLLVILTGIVLVTVSITNVV